MILKETLLPHQVQPIIESNSDSKNIAMKGIFIQGGLRNHNGRVYPMNEISNAVHQINESLTRGDTVLGEADHPEELTINLDRVSHRIDKMWMENNNGCGKLTILPTPMGNIVKTLLECDVKLGVSSRGSGNVDDIGNVSEFEIITVDIVAKPSAPEAYPKAVYEAFNNRKGAMIEDLAHAMKYDEKAQKHLQNALLEWIENLR